MKPSFRISDSSFTQPKNPPPSEVVLDDVDSGEVDEVMEVTEPSKDDYTVALEKFKKSINSMLFGKSNKSKTNHSCSSKTTESSQMMTSKSAPSKMDLVLDLTMTNKGTNSAPKGRVVPMDTGSIYSKINLVPPTASKNQYLLSTKNG